MMRFVTTLLLSLFLAGTLSACGMFGGSESADIVEANPNSAPPTKELLKGLPNDLRGDTENARHTNQPLRGDDDAGNTE
jgi:hypothetical protein